MEKLVDADHPLVIETANRLTEGAHQPLEKLTRIFMFVRDQILFGFCPEGDFIKASQTIERGYGQCNTKGILMLALCRVANITARMHFSDISKEIQRGFFSGVFYWLMPQKITHSWIEVEIDGQWCAIDTYINDCSLHHAAVKELNKRGWHTGFSISAKQGSPSVELSLDNKHYSQMAAVSGDHGVWDEPGDFFETKHYLNRPGHMGQWLYKLYLPFVNRRVKALRQR